MFIANNRVWFKIIIALILISFAGCAGAKVVYVDNGKLPDDNDYDIIALTLKDASIINLKDKKAKFHEKYKDKKNVIVYQGSDDKDRYIELKDISVIKIEVYNKQANVAAVFGAAMLLGFLLYIINKDFGH